ncbi:MAG: type I glyceraldehyde-3-phosphate dehydrogenase, partial [Myxococcaceae bacterium]|nr:type I glyceraldehyde-3-phosphate dehydrogenase [Myxococcaceae bacterium]
KGCVTHTDDSIVINGKSIKLLKLRDPKTYPWADMGVDIVFECTGIFKGRDDAMVHMERGAKKVIISAPAKNPDKTIVMGVNSDQYDKAKDNIVSNASCTTNCLAPIAKVLLDNFGIVKGLMTTIHSYTNDQRILDLPHSDLRRARAGAMSMIPTTTGAAKAVGEVLPVLKGKLDGLAIRVPTPNVSLVDLTVELEKAATKEEINAAMKAASEGALKGILDYSEEKTVSIDYNNCPASSTFDALDTYVIDGKLVKVMAWYDNEYGYSNRMVDLGKLMADAGF